MIENHDEPSDPEIIRSATDRFFEAMWRVVAAAAVALCVTVVLGMWIFVIVAGVKIVADYSSTVAIVAAVVWLLFFLWFWKEMK